MCSWILLAVWCSWTVLIRPQVSVEGADILLRNSVVDLRIPGTLVDDVSVRSYLTLTVGRRKYTSTAVGYRPSSVARGHADLARGLVQEGTRTRIESPVAYTQDYLRAEVARIKKTTPPDGARVMRKLAVLPLSALVLVAALIVLGAWA